MCCERGQPRQGLRGCPLAKATQLVSGGARLVLGYCVDQVSSLFRTPMGLNVLFVCYETSVSKFYPERTLNVK